MRHTQEFDDGGAVVLNVAFTTCISYYWYVHQSGFILSVSLNFVFNFIITLVRFMNKCRLHLLLKAATIRMVQLYVFLLPALIDESTHFTGPPS